MKKVLLLAMIVLIAASVPASAAYKCNWFGYFRQDPDPGGKYDLGPIANLPVGTLGQDNWFLADNPSYVDEVPMDIVDSATHPAVVGPAGVRTHIVSQRTGHSAAARSMTDLNGNGQTYYKGWAKFWVYDPGYTGSVGGADGRVGVYGAQGENNIGKMATAQIQDASSRDPNWWYAQWSYSVGKLDGVTPVAGGSGYTFTQGLPAPRVWGAWSYAMITWTFSYTLPRNPTSGGSGVIKWFVNQSSVSPNLTLNLDSTSTRWAAFHEVKGIFMGCGMTTVSNGKPVAYDSFEFHADPMPEPSSLLALGTGLVGLVGLIRRRK